MAKTELNRLKLFIAVQLFLVFWLGTSLETYGIEKCNSLTDKAPFKVVYFRPSSNLNKFWTLNSEFAEAAAKDLHINLITVEITPNDANRLMFAELFEKYMGSHEPPDFVLSVLYAGGEFSLIQKFNTINVPIFTVNSNMDKKLFALTGYPRKTFNHWKGHMSPNDKEASGFLTKHMHKLSNGGRTVLAIGGSPQSTVNQERIKGLKEKTFALQLNLVPPISTNWSVQDAARAARTLFRRVQQYDMIWTAGPTVAKGVNQALKELSLPHNQKVTIGTFDWTPEVIEMIKTNQVDVSFGGHFMETGWALVLIHDYLRGLDFAEDTGTVIQTKLKKLDKSNLAKIEGLVASKTREDIDFRQYSKCHTPTLTKYAFEIH